MPSNNEWYLRAQTGRRPGTIFSCILTVDFVRQNGDRSNNKIVIDELALRQEDRKPVEVCS